MRIITPESKYWEVAENHGVRRDAVRRTVRSAAQRASRQLPAASRYLTIMVSPDEPENTITETGVGGMTFTEEYISIVFDYNVPYGADVCLANLRSTAAHEVVHAVSYFNAGSFIPAPLQAVVYEGLATVFEEKQYGNLSPWSQYEEVETMNQWLDEIAGLPTNHKNFDYLFTHPDGRRWIIYKTGTWMIETLLARGVPFESLLKLPYSDVVGLYRKHNVSMMLGE